MAKVAFDATILMPLITANLSTPPIDKRTLQPVTYYKERIEYLISSLEESRTKIIVPTPALSEVLVYADDKAQLDYVNGIRQAAVFKIEPFDERCAIEVAKAIREAKQSGDKKSGSTKTWAQVKFDRQIVAIAKVNGASIIYSDDDDVARFARRSGLITVTINELSLPSKMANLPLFAPVPKQ